MTPNVRYPGHLKKSNAIPNWVSVGASMDLDLRKEGHAIIHGGRQLHKLVSIISLTNSINWADWELNSIFAARNERQMRWTPMSFLQGVVSFHREM